MRWRLRRGFESGIERRNFYKSVKYPKEFEHRIIKKETNEKEIED